MTTKKLFAIAVEAIAYASLIALLALLIAIVYGLLSMLSPAPSEAATPAEIPPLTIRALPPARAVLSAAKDVPDYGQMTTRELRPLARDRKIPNWNKLTKQELIAALSAAIKG